MAKSDFIGICKRCGQPVHEDQSHVMVVNVGQERMFFHEGCKEPNAQPDLGESMIHAAHR